MLRINSQGEKVLLLQKMLKRVLKISLSIDGDFGNSTRNAVIRFQKLYGLYPDGIVGEKTNEVLLRAYDTLFVNNSNLLHFGKRRFVVFVDAGHIGISDNGEYEMAGKRAYHKGEEMHERGHYYEGYENRIVAEAFIEEMTKHGIMCIRTYHPSKDWSLRERAEYVESWLRRGYYGYLHSFHSNAISNSNTESKLNSTKGFMVFTTRANNFSDLIAEEHFNNVNDALAEFGLDWKMRKDESDGDSDYEANFAVLRRTDLPEFEDVFGAILEEWGFHTSKDDCNFIISEDSRKARVTAARNTALWVKKYLETNNKEL